MLINDKVTTSLRAHLFKHSNEASSNKNKYYKQKMKTEHSSTQNLSKIIPKTSTKTCQQNINYIVSLPFKTINYHALKNLKAIKLQVY